MDVNFENNMLASSSGKSVYLWDLQSAQFIDNINTKQVLSILKVSLKRINYNSFFDHYTKILT